MYDVRNGIASLVLLLAATAVLAADTTTADDELLKKAGVQTDGPSLLEFFRQRTVDIGNRVASYDPIPQIADRRGQWLELRDIELGERQRRQNDFRQDAPTQRQDECSAGAVTVRHEDWQGGQNAPGT